MPCVTPCSCLLFSFPSALICKESEMTVLEAAVKAFQTKGKGSCVKLSC